VYLFKHHMKGALKKKEGYRLDTRLPRAFDDLTEKHPEVLGVPEWVFEYPMAGIIPGRAGQRPTRMSSVGLALNAAALACAVGAPTLTWVSPQSWNYQGRGKRAVAEEMARLQKLEALGSKARTLLEGSDDAVAAFGVLLWKLWREKKEVTSVYA
jgi:hypothetical protein